MYAVTTTAPSPAAPQPLRTVPAVPAQAAPPARETGATVVPLPLPQDAPQEAPATLIRVERGAATAEELAAVTALLLARAAGARAAADAQAAVTSRRAAARWRVNGFAGPRSWTSHSADLLAG